jgi:hypothetical protein
MQINPPDFHPMNFLSTLSVYHSNPRSANDMRIKRNPNRIIDQKCNSIVIAFITKPCKNKIGKGSFGGDP